MLTHANPLVRCHLTVIKQVSIKPEMSFVFVCFCEMQKLLDILTSANDKQVSFNIQIMVLVPICSPRGAAESQVLSH